MQRNDGNGHTGEGTHDMDNHSEDDDDFGAADEEPPIETEVDELNIEQSLINRSMTKQSIIDESNEWTNRNSHRENYQMDGGTDYYRDRGELQEQQNEISAYKVKSDDQNQDETPLKIAEIISSNNFSPKTPKKQEDG